MKRLMVVALAVCALAVMVGAQSKAGAKRVGATNIADLGVGIVSVGNGEVTIDGKGEFGIVVEDATVTIQGVEAEKFATLFKVIGLVVVRQEGSTTVLEGSGSVWPVSRNKAWNTVDEWGSPIQDPPPVLVGPPVRLWALKVTAKGQIVQMQAAGNLSVALKGKGTIRTTADGKKWGKTSNWPVAKVQIHAKDAVGD